MNEWLYVPTTTPAINKGQQFNNSIRVTYQANPKLKIAGTYKADKWCNCPSQISATRAPEAARDRRFPRLRQEHAEVDLADHQQAARSRPWPCTSTSAGATCTFASTAARSTIRQKKRSCPELISVTEQTNSLVYRARENNNNTQVPNWSYRAAMSYVTGTHAFKVGFNRTHGFLNEYQYAMNPVSYRFNVGVPNQITQRRRLTRR